jgi:uncharacterized damage-inducible protein DinB
MEEQVIETWRIHNRINLYLLDAIADDALTSTLAARHRTVHDLFAHIHNVRLMWLQASAPDLLKGLEKIDMKNPGPKQKLAEALTASGEAIATLLQRGLAPGGKIKGFKPHAVAFVGYLISHESHHRGQIGWTLKNTSHPLDKKTAFVMWEWGVR